MPKVNRKPGIHLHKTERFGFKITKVTKKPVGTMFSQYYWILIAKNGKTVAKSSETYKRKRDAVRSIKIASNIFRFVSPSSFYDHTKKETEQVVY
jgi:hypothetical protein